MFIRDYSFGKMFIQDWWYKKDLKIIQGKVVPDWFRARGHKVGLADIADILGASPRMLVLGQGKPGLMQATAEVYEECAARGIDLEIMSTSKAVDRFNQLSAAGVNVAAGFHLTC